MSNFLDQWNVGCAQSGSSECEMNQWAAGKRWKSSLLISTDWNVKPVCSSVRKQSEKFVLLVPLIAQEGFHGGGFSSVVRGQRGHAGRGAGSTQEAAGSGHRVLHLRVQQYGWVSNLFLLPLPRFCLLVAGCSECPLSCRELGEKTSETSSTCDGFRSWGDDGCCSLFIMVNYGSSCEVTVNTAVVCLRKLVRVKNNFFCLFSFSLWLVYKEITIIKLINAGSCFGLTVVTSLVK